MSSHPSNAKQFTNDNGTVTVNLGGETIQIPNSSTIICRGNLPKPAVEELKTWLFEHFHYPYPTDPEKDALMEKTNLTLTQVNNWFINARRRIWRPIIEKRQEQQQQSAQQSQSIGASQSPRNIQSMQPQQMMTSFPLNPINTVNTQFVQDQNNAIRQDENFKNVFNEAFDGQDQRGMLLDTEIPFEDEKSGFFIENLESNDNAKKRKRDDPRFGRDPTDENPTTESFIEENYNSMLEEYNRLRKENNSLRRELTIISTNFEKTYSSMSQRHDVMLSKISELEGMQSHLETSNNNMIKKLHEVKRVRLAAPVATRPVPNSSKEHSAFKEITKPASRIPVIEKM